MEQIRATKWTSAREIERAVFYFEKCESAAMDIFIHKTWRDELEYSLGSVYLVVRHIPNNVSYRYRASILLIFSFLSLTRVFYFMLKMLSGKECWLFNCWNKWHGNWIMNVNFLSSSPSLCCYVWELAKK